MPNQQDCTHCEAPNKDCVICPHMMTDQQFTQALIAQMVQSPSKIRPIPVCNKPI